MKKNKNKWIEKVILIVCVVAAIAVYMAVPSVHQGMNRVFAMFATGDFTVLRDFVASYGAYAAALSFLLMIRSPLSRHCLHFLLPLPMQTYLAGGRELFYPGPVLWQAQQSVSTLQES